MISITNMFALFLVPALLVGCAESNQTPTCAQYVACVRALDAQEDVTTNAKRFEPGGACWGSPEGAELCDRACKGGLAYQQSIAPDGPEVCR